MQQAPVGLGLLDVDGRWQWVNDALHARLQSVTIETTTIASRIEPGEAVQHVVGDVEIAFTPSRDAAGRLQHIVVSTTDMSDRNAAIAALRASEELFRAFFEQVGLGTGQCALDGTITFVNPRFCAITGYTAEELRQKTFVDITHPGDSGGEIQLVTDLLAGVIDWYTLEKRYVRKDGSLVWVNLTVSVSRDAAGEPTSLLGVIEDISRRKNAEDALRESLAAKETLLGEIHHRVKNNLQVICSLLALQSGHVDDETLREILEQSQGRVRSMAMVHERLYRSNTFSGVDLAAHVESLLSAIASSYPDRARFVVMPPETSVEVDIDTAIPVGLVINELVVNACKHAFAPGARGTITLSCACDAEGLAMTVQDDGVGLPAGFVLDQPQGRSLGLQLVRALVAQLRGSIEMTSDKGTRATLRVPHPCPPKNR